MKMLSYSDLKPQKGIPFTRKHIGELVKKRLFPAPAKLGEGRLAYNFWVEHEIDAWLAARAAARDAAPAAQCEGAEHAKGSEGQSEAAAKVCPSRPRSPAASADSPA